MKLKKSELEALIKEAVNREVSQLNEEELQELMNFLRGLGGVAAAGAQGVANAAAGAKQAVTNKAQAVGSAVKGAYQKGQLQGGVKDATQSILGTWQTVQKLGSLLGDPNAQGLDPATKASIDANVNVLSGVKKLLSNAYQDLTHLKIQEQQVKKKPGSVARTRKV